MQYSFTNFFPFAISLWGNYQTTENEPNRTYMFMSLTLSLTCSLDPDLHVHNRLILPLVIPGDSAREGLVDLLDLSGLEVHKFGNFFSIYKFFRGLLPIS